MAKSRFEYVKAFELDDSLLPNSFIVVRVDGRGFHKFTEAHGFEKPNDVRALGLMDRAAKSVLEEFGDVVLGFGESDEYSFLIRRSSNLYNRRRSKINSSIASIFTSSYVFHWSTYLPDIKLLYPPTFDSRVVLYPGTQEIRDYFAWRQADTHINNLYNTTFWALIQHGGMSTAEAHKALQGTFAKDKNEILYKYGINYNSLSSMLRKGSILVRISPETATQSNLPSSISIPSTTLPEETQSSVPAVETVEKAEAPKKDKKDKKKRPYEGTSGEITIIHEDMIKDIFWKERPWLLA